MTHASTTRAAARRSVAAAIVALGVLLVAAPRAPAQTPSGAAPATGDAQAPWRALADGAIVLFRHASAPGTGDPSTFTLGDCATQRNLSDDGREQARRIGRRLKAEGVAVGAVWSSQWCRTLETARLLDLAPVREVPAFNSFFAGRGDEAAQTEQARDALRRWAGPGALVVVTHQVNITALTGIYPRSGEGVVLRRAVPETAADALDVAGRVLP
ncbi:MAG: histidine phosphatase family protein [Lautropia sp.]